MKPIPLFMMIALMIILPGILTAAEFLTEEELGEVTAKEGVSIFLEGKINIEQEFTNIGIGDDDGIGGDSSPGWLIAYSDGETSYIEVSLKDAKIEIDVASTGADGYDIIGDGEPDIPAYTSFVRFGLPQKIELNTYLAAGGYHLLLNNEYSTNGASHLGIIRVSDLQIHANNTPTALYIYGH